MSLMFQLRKHIRASLDENTQMRIKRFQRSRFRLMQHLFCRFFLGSNLSNLAIYYGTDKMGEHRYTKHYENHFRSFRHKNINLLEIGIGGYSDSETGGGSLRMWRAYFPKARIFGVDIHDKSSHDERRIKTFMGSQADNDFLNWVVKNIGKIDIVIDDGSHQNQHVLSTFKFLYPKIDLNGIYVIEDVQTSYWENFGGSSVDLQRKDTSMGFLKQRVDGLNHSEFEVKNYVPNYFDKYIFAIHFYHNIVFIQKGTNS